MDDEFDELLKNYSNDEEKFKALQDLSTDISKMLVIVQISSESLLLQSMDIVEEEDTKLEIAYMLSDNNSKLEAIKKLTSEKNKVKIAKTLSRESATEGFSSIDDIKESSILPNLHKIASRVELINSFVDKERREKLIQQEMSFFQEKANIILEKSQTFKLQDLFELPRLLTIGIELEANGISPYELYIYFSNLKSIYPNLSDWLLKTDATIPFGSEITSPVLTFSPKSMQDLYFITEIMKILDFEPGANCGGHIHFGICFFEFDENGKFNKELRNQSLKNLLTIWGEAEELFFKISNAENDITRSSALKPSGGGDGYASSIGQIIQNCTKNGDLDLDAACARIELNRYRSINLLNLHPHGIDTIEFRLSNSTLESTEILQNIYLYGRLMVVSKDIVLHPEKYTIKLSNFKNKDVSEAEKVEALLDLLFENESQKCIYRKRWRSVRDAEIYDLLKLKSPTFRKGDYSLKEEILDVSDDVSLSEMDNFEEAVSLSSISKNEEQVK